MAKCEVLDILQLATLHDAPRVAGPEQCKYCPAKTKCPEYRETFVTLVPRAQDFALTAHEWTPEQRARFCEVLPEITRWLDDRKNEIKNLAKQGHVPGWKVGEGRKKKKITDPQKAFYAVSDVLDLTAFTRACTVSLPQLTKLYANTEKMSEKTAKEILAKKMKKIIEETQDEGQLEKIK